MAGYVPRSFTRVPTVTYRGPVSINLMGPTTLPGRLKMRDWKMERNQNAGMENALPCILERVCAANLSLAKSSLAFSAYPTLPTKPNCWSSQHCVDVVHRN